VKFLADENFPRAAARELTAAGHEVLLVTEHCSGATDHEVLALAVNHGATLLTFDRDFGELVFHRELPCPKSVIYLRIVPASPVEPASLVKKLLANTNSIDGDFIVLERNHFRRRKLPTSDQT
jgi:predicted nuclease of predicted toxin-antitoxin system